MVKFYQHHWWRTVDTNVDICALYASCTFRF